MVAMAAAGGFERQRGQGFSRRLGRKDMDTQAARTVPGVSVGAAG